jgi:hypothetical protein
LWCHLLDWLNIFNEIKFYDFIFRILINFFQISWFGEFLIILSSLTLLINTFDCNWWGLITFRGNAHFCLVIELWLLVFEISDILFYVLPICLLNVMVDSLWLDRDLNLRDVNDYFYLFGFCLFFKLELLLRNFVLNYRLDYFFYAVDVILIRLWFELHDC